jgi:hypothetical protein
LVFLDAWGWRQFSFARSRSPGPWSGFQDIGQADSDHRQRLPAQDLADYERILAEFERRNGMTTAEFQRGFESGELSDAPEWFDWDGYAALAEEARKKLAEIEHAVP